MIYVRDAVVAMIFFGFLITGARYGDINNPVIDWVILGLCSVSPLIDPKIRKGKLWATAILILVNAATMFFMAFWIVAVIFGDGL